MKVLGYRAEKDTITWALVDDSTTPHLLVDHGVMKAPGTYSESEALALFRERVIALVRQFSPDSCAIKYPEPSARLRSPSSTFKRLRIEGIILEAVQFANVSMETGSDVAVSARLGASKSAANYRKKDDIRGLKFPKKSDVLRDAIIAADSVLWKDK